MCYYIVSLQNAHSDFSITITGVFIYMYRGFISVVFVYLGHLDTPDAILQDISFRTAKFFCKIHGAH